MNFGALKVGMNAARRVATIAGLVALLCAVSSGAARAFPKFSQKEKKPCSYCHVNASGGGKRNAAGMWYQQHGLSFAGYTPAGAAGGKAATATIKKSAAPKKPVGKVAKKPVPKKPAKKK